MQNLTNLLKTTIGKIVVGLLGLTLLCCTCTFFGGIFSEMGNKVSRGVSEEAQQLPTFTPTPTITPTPINFPLVAQSTDWNFIIHKADMRTSLASGNDNTVNPESGAFLILVGDIENKSAQSGCMTTNEWELINSDTGEKYNFNFYAVEAVKQITNLDQPGVFLGTCVDSGQKQSLFVVFDVEPEAKLALTFRKNNGGQPIQLDTASSIANVPTATPTVTPESTFTPEATLEPTPTLETQVNAGMGITRAEIQSVFESPEIGFKFEPSSDVEGQPRIMGTSENGLATLELIGPPENLVSASIIIGLPNDDQEALLLNNLYAAGLIKTVAPDWEEGTNWYTDNLVKIATTGETEVSTTHENLEIKLQGLKELGLVLLAIKGKEGGAGQPLAPPSTSEITGPLVTAGENEVNIRSGPGTDYNLVGTLPANQSLEIIGRNADNSWWQVSTPNGLGWIAASVTTASNVDDSISRPQQRMDI